MEAVIDNTPGGTERKRLSGLRRVDSSAQMLHADRYTRVVRLLRILLPLAALVIIGVLISRLNQSPQNIQVMPTTEETAEPSGEIEMLAAKYSGVDAAGRPFRITAERASRPLAGDENVMLESPVGRMQLDGEDWIAARADTGRYRAEDSRLLLQGNVKLYNNTGYVLVTEKMVVSTSDGRAVSETRVRGKGPAGTIDAKGGVDVIDNGARTVFKGPAKLVLQPGKMKQDGRGE